MSAWPQPPGAAASIGCRISRCVCCQTAIFGGGGLSFGGFLSWSSLADVADPVVVFISDWSAAGTAARVPQLAAA